jgi:hypothetical protein
MRLVLSLGLSTVAFFVTGFFMKRYLDSMDIPKGMTRSLTIFSVALAVSYGVAMSVDFLVP